MLSLAPFPNVGNSEINQWFSGGPEGAYITAIATDPHREGALYVGTLEGHVFKSTDYGKHWKMSGSSFSPEMILSLAADPEKPDTVYAGTSHFDQGLFKSTDGGQHWLSIGLSGRDVAEIVIDPTNSSKIYVASRFSVYKSLNSGEHWLNSTEGLKGEIYNISLDSNEKVLYVSGDEILFKSTDEGKTWFCDGEFNGSIRKIAVANTRPATLYVATSSGLFQRQQNGIWSKLISDTNDWDFNDVIINPRNPLVIYATAAKHGALKSEDGGDSWKEINNQFPILEASELAIDSKDRSILYVANGPSIFRTTDSGQTWSDIGFGLRDLSIMNLSNQSSDPNRLYAATCKDVFKTSDGGQIWQRILSVQPCARALIVNPQQADVVYVGTDDGILKSIDAGKNWKRIGPDQPKKILELTIDPMHPQIMYATFDSGGGMLKTTDAGLNWTNVLQGTISPIAIDSRHPNVIYAAVFSDSHDQILKSDDGGMSWVLTGLTSMVSNTVHDDVNIWAISVDPTNSNVIYAAGRDPGSEYGFIFKSNDSGKSWRLITSGLTNPASYALAINPKSPNEVFVGTEEGVFISVDGGANWRAFNKDLPPSSIEALTIDSGGKLLSASTERGVFRIKLKSPK